VDYDLSRLGSREFEHLSQAIAIRVLGPGVMVFGSGPDGGREATFDGPVDYPRPAAEGPWRGRGVLQAKFKERSTGTTADNKWLVKQIKQELTTWATPESRRRRSLLPEYILFTTNVWLSSVPKSGGMDAARREIGSFADALGLKGWDVWGGDQICRYLDNFADIRQAFAGFVTPGDVLERLRRLLGDEAADIGQVAGEHAGKELFAGQWVRLNQAGSPDNEKLKLADIGIDLPGIGEGRSDTPLIADAISRGDMLMRPSARRGQARHLVWIGGPGQGKSTLTQMLAQVYRVALLAERPAHRLGPAAAVLASLQNRLAELKLPTPRCRRWPITVNLNDYGEAVSRDQALTLIGFISQQVGKRLDRHVSAAHLKSWLGSWPWLLILDGLDEVAAASARDLVEERINQFLIDAADIDADLLVVGTTRPQGYNGEFAHEQFVHLTLRSLDADEAVGYAHRLSEVRHAQDPDLADQVASRMRRAAQEPMTARLMRSPLQVTIMTLLLERHTRVPDSRHALFESYYDTIYSREVSKGGPTAKLLEEHRNDVNAIHQQVALLLHARAEDHPDSESLVSSSELDALARARLRHEGVTTDEARTLAARLVAAATTRLVLLAPIARDHVGFDVRSLQEFMAARAVSTGPDEEVLARMRALAPSAHWRNTWLLAAGRIFSRSEHLRPGLISVLGALNTEAPLAMLIAPGSRLALDMLDDDTAARARGFQRIVVTHALELLNQPPGGDVERLAEALQLVVTRDPEVEHMILSALRRATESVGWPLLSGVVVLAEFADRPGPIQASARSHLRTLLRTVDGVRKNALIDVSRTFPHRSLRSLENLRTDAQYEKDFPYLFESLLSTPLTDPRSEAARQRLTEVIEQYDPSPREAGVPLRSILNARELWTGYRPDRRTLLPSQVDSDVPEAYRTVDHDLALLGGELGLTRWWAAETLWSSLAQAYSRLPVTHKLGGLLDDIDR
jgi:hypothetical protein